MIGGEGRGALLLALQSTSRKFSTLGHFGSSFASGGTIEWIETKFRGFEQFIVVYRLGQVSQKDNYQAGR